MGTHQEQRQREFEAWKADPFVAQTVPADATLLFFRLKQGAPFVEQAADFVLAYEPQTPMLEVAVRHGQAIAERRGFGSLNEMLAEQGGLPKWAIETEAQ